MKYIIDSYAWLEYFMGTIAGEKVKEIVDSVVYEKLTPTICVAEIYAKSSPGGGIGKGGTSKSIHQIKKRPNTSN